jgi:sugar O-acyltransferase (sialic acid O-acetyltransferase NeuD family)
MRRIVVVGGAAQARQVIAAVEEAGDAMVVGVLDRDRPAGDTVAGYPVLGTDRELASCARTAGADGFVVAIGDNASRGAVLERELASADGVEPVTVVHPHAAVARDAVIGEGSIVLAGAVVSNGCTVGRGVLLGTACSIDHDCRVGDFASLAPHAATGGDVSIGRFTAVGLGANVIHGLTIGDHTVVGAGALVLTDLPDLVVAYGSPAQVVRARVSGEPYLDRR